MNFEKVKEYVLKRLQNELPEDLYYHKLEHSLDVLQAAERIAAGEGVSEDEMVLVKTAAILHDTGFVNQYDKNEPLGCEIASTILPECAYAPEQIQMVCNMIMATALPQSPKTHLEDILCDADLDYLGREDFYPIAAELRQELQVHGRRFTDAEWLQFEIDFLESHQYFTGTSRQNRGPKKQEYLSELKETLATVPGLMNS